MSCGQRGAYCHISCGWLWSLSDIRYSCVHMVVCMEVLNSLASALVWFSNVFSISCAFCWHVCVCACVCVEVCVYGYKFPSGPRLYRSCHITGTDDLQWRSERGCVHVMDHCSRTRRCRFPLFCFSFALRASWSEVVLRRFSTRTLGALKLDIPACFYVCFLTFGDRYSLHFYITA